MSVSKSGIQKFIKPLSQPLNKYLANKSVSYSVFYGVKNADSNLET